jgi:hypothetical protein
VIQSGPQVASIGMLKRVGRAIDLSHYGVLSDCTIRKAPFT